MFLLCVAGLPLSTIHAQKKEIIDDEAPNGIVIVTECLYVIPKYNGGIYLRRFHGLRRPPLHH